MSVQTSPIAPCLVCGGQMALTGVLPGLGPYPALHTVECVDCKDVETRIARTADRPDRALTWFREARVTRRASA